MKSLTEKIWKYIGGVNGLLLVLYLIFAFTSAVITNKHLSRYYFAGSLLIIVVLTVVVSPIVMRLFSKASIKPRKKNGEIRFSTKALLFTVFFFVSFICFLLYFIAFYPGGYYPDSFSQYHQAMNSEYNDWHPVMHTLVAFKLPLAITDGWVGSIVLFQIICFSLVLAYSFTVIYNCTGWTYTVLSMIYILGNPQTGNIAMFPLKDVSFAIGALLLLTYALQIYVTKGEWVRKPINMAFFIVAEVLTTLFRHNAVLFTVPLIAAVLFFMTWKRGLALCIAVLMLYTGVKGPFYNSIGVVRPGERIVEMLGLPMTVIGAAATYTEDRLDDETREFALKVAPREVWEEKFMPGCYNWVKWDSRTNNGVIEAYGARRVVSMMFRCFRDSGVVSVVSLIRLTEAAYTFSNSYGKDFSLVMEPGVLDNNENIAMMGNKTMATLIRGFNHAVSDLLPHVFLYLGVMHFILILAILSKNRLNRLNDLKKIFFVLPVFAYNYGTTLLLTGMNDAPRFFFYTFMLMPCLLIILLQEEDEERTERQLPEGI